MRKIFIILICYTFGFFLLSASQCLSAPSITQGEYAIKLAERLCLGENLSAEAAIAALAKVGVMPADGWKPGDPMNWVKAGEILMCVRKACKEKLFYSLTCCCKEGPLPDEKLDPLSDKKLAPLLDECCLEVDGLVSSLNQELGLVPPTPPTLPPNPPRDPASVSS